MGEMRLSHYSKSDTLTPHSVKQERRPHFKPRGLWLSVDGEDDWPAWCRDNEFDLGEHRWLVTLRRQPFVLSTADDLLRFTGDYGVGPWFDDIDWTLVAARHPGIIIAPYIWELRLDRRAAWYYPWDCASGCIWDAGAIKSVTLADDSAGTAEGGTDAGTH